MRCYTWGGVGKAKTRPDQRLGGLALIFLVFLHKDKKNNAKTGSCLQNKKVFKSVLPQQTNVKIAGFTHTKRHTTIFMVVIGKLLFP